MGSATNSLEKAMLDHFLGGPDYARPGQIYVGLSRAEIEEDGSGVDEPDGAAGYARVEVTNNNTNFPDAEINAEDKAETELATQVDFPEATGSWGTITHFFLADSSAGENILLKGELVVAKEVEEGDNPGYSFRAGEIIITKD